MSKKLEALIRLEHSSKRYKGRKEDLDMIFTALKTLEIIKKDANLVIAIMSNCKGGKKYDLLKEELL